MRLKKEIQVALQSKNEEKIIELYKAEPAQTLRLLQMFVFDRPQVITRWYAIDMMALLASKFAQDEDEAFRNLIRRFIWHMCEEGANVPWASPEVVGAIVGAVPGKQFEEFIGPLFYHAGLNEINHAGLFWAVGRLAKHHSEEVRRFFPDSLPRLVYDDPEIRGYGVWALQKFPIEQAKPFLERITEDVRSQDVYENGKFKTIEIGSEAKKILATSCFK